MAGTLNEALDLALQASTKTGKVIAAFEDVKKQLADILAGEVLSPAAQEKVEQLLAIEAGDIAALDAANPETPPVEPPTT